MGVIEATVLFRRDVSSGVNTNRVLARGEPGAEYDAFGSLIKLGVGDGVTRWADLPNVMTPAVINHDWNTDGWAAFTPVTISADGPQAFTTSVVNSRGVIAGTQPPPNGSLRVAYQRKGTKWADSEITSLFAGPVPAWNQNAQQGHIHRMREVSPGLWEGIAAWNAVFGGDYSIINTRAVRFDGVTLFQSNGDAAFNSDINFIDRRLEVVSKLRGTAFGLFFNNYGCVPAHLYGLSGGNVTITSGDATFAETNVTLTGATPGAGILQVQETVTLSTSAIAADQGTIVPAGNDAQKRWLPYWFSTRVRGGNDTAAVIEVKRWRPEDPEPDWGDVRVVRANVTTNAGVPSIATQPGMCALWGAHFTNAGPAGTFGPARFRKVV
jgi:hypothetical protein